MLNRALAFFIDSSTPRPGVAALHGFWDENAGSKMVAPSKSISSA